MTGISGAGWGMACTHVLYGESTSTSPVRLASDQNAAGAANCIDLGAYNHMLFDIKVSAYQQGTFEYRGLGVGERQQPHDRGHHHRLGDRLCPAISARRRAPTHANGLSAATLQFSADATNGCLNVTVTPGERHRDGISVAVIRRLKVR